MVAPIVPFVSEEIYTSLTGEESVHLAYYPEYDENMINEKVEERMDLVRDLISLGRNAREEVKIKEDTTATSRCMPFEQEEISDVCVCCGKPAHKLVYWGKAY